MCHEALTPFSNIPRRYGFLLHSLYFLPWLLLTAASCLPRADRDSGRGTGGGGGGYRKPLRLETDWSKALNPQALSLGDFRVLFLFKGSPPQQDRRQAEPVWELCTLGGV